MPHYRYNTNITNIFSPFLVSWIFIPSEKNELFACSMEIEALRSEEGLCLIY